MHQPRLCQRPALQAPAVGAHLLAKHNLYTFAICQRFADLHHKNGRVCLYLLVSPLSVSLSPTLLFFLSLHQYVMSHAIVAPWPRPVTGRQTMFCLIFVMLISCLWFMVARFRCEAVTHCSKYRQEFVTAAPSGPRPLKLLACAAATWNL